MATPLKGFVNFGSPEWAAVKRYLLEVREQRVARLISPEDERSSDRLRGAINLIDQLLSEETAALRPR